MGVHSTHHSNHEEHKENFNLNRGLSNMNQVNQINPDKVVNFNFNIKNYVKYPTMPQIKQSSKYTIKYSDIKEAFRSLSLTDLHGEYYITCERFNMIIATLLKFDIPILSNSYLSTRLFELLGKKEAYKIYEDEFLKGINFLFISNEAKSKITFEAMKFPLVVDKENENLFNPFQEEILTLNEIFHYFMLSWKSGFHILYNILTQFKEEFSEKRIFRAEHHQLDYLLKNYEKNVKYYIMDSFKEYSVDFVHSGVSYEIFKKWVTKDHDLEVTYYNKKVKVAMTLMCLKDIDIVSN